MSGSVLAQALGLGLSFVLTRIYSPENFGTLEQFAMVLAIFGVIITGKYEFAILLPKKDNEAAALTHLAARITLISGGIFGGIFILFQWPIARYYDNPDWHWIAWFVGLGLIGFGLTNTITYRLNREQRYKAISYSKALFSFVSEPLKLGLSYFAVSGVTLVISVVAGHIITTLFLLSRMPILKKLRANRELQKAMAKEYKAYPTYNLFGSLLNRLAQWAHIALFSYFFGLAVIGYLGLCRRVAMMPLTLFSASFSQVYYRRVTDIEDASELRKNYLMNLGYLCLVGGGMIGVIWLLPDNTMTFLFGEEWTNVLDYMRILIFWFAANFAVSAVSFVNHRLRAQRMMFFLDLTHFLLVVIAIGVAWKLGFKELDSIKALVLAKVVYYAIHILATLRALNRNKIVLGT